MFYPAYLKDFVQKFLPYSSEIITLEKPKGRPAIIMADIDGDRIQELIVAYKLQGESYIVVLKNFNNFWVMADVVKGKGYSVTYLDVGAIVSKRASNIIVGWQQGSIWSKLDIMEWSRGKLKSLIGEDIFYSKIDVQDMPSKKSRDGREEIALWIHDTGEAYKVEVYRWKDGKLNPAVDVYPYYFKKVAEYYKKLVKANPDYPFYWYYLADAELKAEMPEEALGSIDVAIKLKGEYPSEEELLKLRREIISKLGFRDIGLFPASMKTIDGTRWGYINNKGEFIIKPTYDYAMDFQSNGLAVVQKDNLSGIINESGNYIVKPKYQDITAFSEGRAAVVDSDGFKLIDENGREVTNKAYSYIGTFNNGRALASETIGEQYLYGYLDRDGNVAIPLRYKSANDFKNGKALVQIKDNEFAMIDEKGDVLNTYNYGFVGPVGENGFLSFSDGSGGKYGYINEEGKVVIEPQYSAALPFQQGRAVVNTAEDYSNKYGLIDREGNFIINPEYNDISIIGERRVAIGKAIDKDKPYFGSEYAIGDTDGRFLSEFKYYNVTEYKQGLASVSDGKNTFFIDRSGNAASGLPVVQGQGTLSIIDDLIRVNVDMKISYLDKEGKVIWSQNKFIPLSDKYKISEEEYKPNKDYIVYYPKVGGMGNKDAQEGVNEKLKELSGVKDIPEDIQLDYSYSGDFDIEFFKKDLLVLELNGYQFYFGAAHGMPSKIYPHVDLVSGKFYELKDLFKENSNYVEVLSNIIGEQIKNNEEYSYVFPDAYKGISADQPFYVNEEALYIYFTPYEIAPYAAGFPTFKIPYDEIKSIINMEGPFWKSFN